jgi:hypothetical protein
VHALGCECTFWLGTAKEDMPAMAWAPCPSGTLDGLACERLSIAGYDESAGWLIGTTVRPDTTNGGAPLVVTGAVMDFYQPPLTRAHWWWLDMGTLSAKVELASDRSKGTCYADLPRVAPGRIVADVDQSKESREGGGAFSFTGASGFVTLTDGAAGAIEYLASDPFQGGSIYTATSDGVYGRLLSNTSGGLYRAEGKKTDGLAINTSPFGSAFPLSGLGPLFVIDLQTQGYAGMGLYTVAEGFRPFLPPSPEQDRGAFNLGSDGATMVWTDMRKKISEYRFAENDVFAAPYTTSPSTIATTGRRLTKAFSAKSVREPWAVGCGLAAQRWELTVQVVRLSDGAHWVIEDPVHKTSFGPRAITCEHIYGTLDNGPLMRLRVDKLGEPKPAE